MSRPSQSDQDCGTPVHRLVSASRNLTQTVEELERSRGTDDWLDVCQGARSPESFLAALKPSG